MYVCMYVCMCVFPLLVVLLDVKLALLVSPILMYTMSDFSWCDQLPRHVIVYT